MKIDYRDFVKYKCERCGCDNTQVLVGHHKDRNRNHNTIDNIQTLCFNCYFIVHHHGWDSKPYIHAEHIKELREWGILTILTEKLIK